MAKNMNGVGFVAFFLIVLLISTGIQKGSAESPYCKKIPSEGAAAGTCLRKDGDAVCKGVCKKMGIIDGRCLILPNTKATKKSCYCYFYDHGEVC
ncbi:hypothetical protein AALP_AA6G313300 [Arabis alpina]|uniref:Knottin scorpion toxin-like domain-containing protein n=1 Tax=Arabis alpina TaxID=50452 RepID=A0A087GSX1_ARAAL|nr:hypothetical protein AALP_AA6G313300 [Arabis alpina]